MRMLVTGKQMKTIDAYTIHVIDALPLVLMGRAALKMAQITERLWKKGDIVWAVCGTDDNGADGMTAAKTLRLKGYPVRVFLVGNPDKGIKGFRTQFTTTDNVGLSSLPWQGGGKEECGLLIGAVFGVELSHPVEREYRQRTKMLRARSIRGTVAVDVLSGVHRDTGTVMGITLRADLAVTSGWEKTGTTLYPGREYAGRTEVADVGFPGQALGAMEETEGTAASDFTVTYEDGGLKRILGQPAYSSKGTFGKVLIMAGSRNIYGAVYLSASSVYRTGVRLTELLMVGENRQVLREHLSGAIVTTYTPGQLMEGRGEFRKMIEAQMEWTDVVVLGPGLRNGPYAEYLVENIPTSTSVSVIINADGLNAIAGYPYLASCYTENIIVTPYPGEIARLTEESVDQIKKDLAATALEYTGRYGLTCVLKDAATATTGRNGSLYTNSSGSSVVAKAGPDGVLIGIMTGLIAIDMDKEETVCLGVYPHGRTGDTAASESGAHSLLASELAGTVGSVIAVV